jgi:hypothetical protein
MIYLPHYVKGSIHFTNDNNNEGASSPALYVEDYQMHDQHYDNNQSNHWEATSNTGSLFLNDYLIVDFNINFDYNYIKG